MQTPAHEYYNFYFTNSPPPNTFYFCESSPFGSQYDCINMLIHGYLQCISNCKGFFGRTDKRSTELLRMAIYEIFRAHLSWEKNIKPVLTLADQKWNLITIIKNFERNEPGNPQAITTFIEQYKQTFDNSLTYFRYPKITYQLTYDHRGPMVNYEANQRVHNYIQMYSWILLFRHLAPKLDYEQIDLLMFYFAAIISCLDAGDHFSNSKDIASLIQKTTNMMLEVATHKNNPKIQEFMKYLPQ